MTTRLSRLRSLSAASRAASHRAMARAALFSDSSLRVRYQRYEHHMHKARQLESIVASAAQDQGVVS